MNIINEGKTIDRKIKHSSEINEELERINQPQKNKNNDNNNKDYLPENIKENFKRRKGGLEKLGDRFFQFFSWLETKIFALLSVSLAVLVIYYSNFFNVIIRNEKVDQKFFYISVISYIITLIIFIYLSYYLPYFKKINEDQWNEYTPNSIPIATFCIVVGMISLIISAWNVWGVFTIPIILIMKVGLLMTVHFVPGGEIGSIIFFMLVIGVLASGRFIEHEGHLH